MIRERLSAAADVFLNTLRSRGLDPFKLSASVLAGLLLVAQLAQITYYIAQNADAGPVILARDDDAGNAINWVQKSAWYRSNGFHSYGPLYFRIAHSLGAVMSPLDQPGDLGAAEARSKAAHYGLMLTSLLGLVGLAFLLSSCFVRELYWRATLAVWWIWILLHSTIWQTFLLRAHPDYILSLTIAGAALATFQLWKTPEDANWFRLSAWAWGLALATKMTTMLWMPWVALSLLFPFQGVVRRYWRFGLHVAAAYFLIGFPQNFEVHKVIRFLHYQGSLSLPADAASVREWLGIWGAQIWAPALFALALVLTTVRAGRPQGALLWRAAVLSLGPLALILAQKVLAPHEHYPMPLVATQVALLCAFATPFRLAPRWGFGLLAASAAAFVYLGVTPASFSETLKAQLPCRSEARAVFQKVQSASAQGKSIYVDPYVPVLDHTAGVKSDWYSTRASLSAGQFDVLFFSRRFHARYHDLSAAEYVHRDNPQWQGSTELYDLFDDHDQVNDPQLGNWRREYTDQCGWEIWRRTP